MRYLTLAASLAALSSVALAQDRITLSNGDVLTGSIKSMADGKVTINSALLGDVVVPMSNIQDMVTKEMVTLETANGDRLVNRRIVGLEGGNLRLEGDTTSLALANLGKINPPEKPEPTWTGSLNLSGLWVEGNTDRRAVGLAMEASRRAEIDRITVDAAWDYSEDKDQATAVWSLNQRRAGGGIKYDYFLSKKWYALATARVLGDTLADIQLRFTGGVGIGYTWIEEKDATFTTELGLSYFNENYRTVGVESVDYLAARAAYKYVRQLSEATRLVHGCEAFPSLEDGSDFYLQAKTEIVTSLTDSMIAGVAHVLDYDNTPAPGRDRVDNRVLLTIGWSF
ncbi:MAG: DUF481 domain-containing protein [Planctomycetes bacterium]|nr:DUF481 domain-containing protein [Planctomycetota bacterium]